MSQNREPPGYLEYAAAIMAKLAYRTMTLQERGLAWTMRKECWVNGKLPGRHDLLAKVLGVTQQEIDDCLPAVMAFFDESDGMIFCPELEDYRKHLEERRENQRRHGKAGAAITNSKRKPPKKRMDSDDTATPTGTPTGTPLGSPLSPRRGQVGVLIQSSPIQTNQTQSLEKEVIPDPFVAAMDKEEARQEASLRVKVTV
jgi:hypothetical protein